MRRRPTRAERRFKKVLRQALQGSNYKVVTQRMFVNTKAAKQKGYIVDFYIPVLKLAIEIDGSSHDSKQAGKYDVVRTSFLAYRGVKVLRFTNEETHQQDHCITRLQEAISDREKTMLDRQRVYQDAPVKPCISRQDEVDLQTAFIAERGVTLCKSK